MKMESLSARSAANTNMDELMSLQSAFHAARAAARKNWDGRHTGKQNVLDEEEDRSWEAYKNAAVKAGMAIDNGTRRVLPLDSPS